ncbi:MAG: hypothetical protein Q8R16_01605 [bacterium]|nr:hypothetical protein [bacterium]
MRYGTRAIAQAPQVPSVIRGDLRLRPILRVQLRRAEQGFGGQA